MKCLRLIAALCTFSLFISACKKDDSGSPSSTSQARLKTYTEMLNPGLPYGIWTTYNLAYDQDNRLLSLTDSKDPGNSFTFNYVQDGYDFNIYGAGNLVIHQDVFMNGTVIDSTIQYNNEGDTTSEKYVYWAGKLLKYMLRYEVTSSGSLLDNVVEYTYDSNDALIKEQDYYSTTLYTYNANLINNIDLYPVYINRSKQLPTKVTYSDGSEEITWNHSYTFDAENRLTADTSHVSTGDVIVKKFTYE